MLKKQTLLMLVSWSLTLTIFVALGVCMQCILFKHDSNTVLNALLTFPLLWLIYLLVSLVLGERIFIALKNTRFFKR